MCATVGAYILLKTKGGPRDRAYRRCMAAATSSNTEDWTEFCDTIPTIVRGAVAGNDSASRECDEKTYEPPQTKINWCENQFGKN